MEGRSVYVENVGLEWKNVVYTSFSIIATNEYKIIKMIF